MTERRVALKVLEPDDAGGYRPQTKARIDRELRVLGQLTSPFSVRLFAFGQTDDGRTYLVFEHVDGRDLDEILRTHGRLEATLAVHILRQVLTALAEAHREGLVHRDIKPENIRVFATKDDPWRAKLLDFGIARSIGPAEAQVTATGELIGTPRYMAPEQLLGEEIGPAADLYALGIVGFEMLVGREAMHGGRWADQLDRLKSGYLFPAGEAATSHALSEILQRMTARAVDQRFQSADAVLAALDRLGDRSHGPLGTAAATAVMPPAPRTRLVIPTLLVLVIALVAIAFATYERAEEPAQAVSMTRPVPSLAIPAEEREVARPEPEDGCGRQDAPATGRQLMDTLAGLTSHEWITYVPQTYEVGRRHPLLILLHQDGEHASALLDATRFEALADQHQFIVIAPLDGDRAWRDGAQDVAWLEKVVLRRMERDFCIDPARIFVVGHSQGGMVAELLTCKDWVAAVATHSHRPGSAVFPCERPKPHIALAPKHDRHIPFEGGKGCATGGEKASVAEVEKAWRTRNGCSGARQAALQTAGGTCFRWTCEVPFESCHLEGGHQWPGAQPRPWLYDMGCDGTPADFPSAERIWAFFSELTAPAP